MSVLIAAVVAGAGAFALGVSGSTTEVTLRVSRVAPGIKSGTSVEASGFRVGKVRDVVSLESGQTGVVLSLSDSQGLTDSMNVEFGSGSLFGVAAVVLSPRSGGGPLRDGMVWSPAAAPADNTIASILDLVGAVNQEAIRPNAGQLLANANRTVGAVQPWLTTLGSLAAAVSDTEKVRPGDTLPTWAELLRTTSGRLPSLLDALDTMNSFAPGHDRNWASLLNDAVDANAAPGTGSTIGAVRAILTPEAARSLDQAAPLLSALANPITASLGGRSGQVGIDLEKVLHAFYSAMPTVSGAPVLNVSVIGQPTTSESAGGR
ncbi:MlaD family protein [Tsukamurella ocularis]|uniref:MlaD family protein n=1 Tax=Tsukamurella ocularis TaxID=1970234 RepID=UPI0021677D40|nr:MlaD family protein [Tsukamurella ocularis]MCS3779430.1 ABC-type transporter Mla subunit MlaD [Tsukamurella ocularis]MCS3788096.1 ABC-type transporter Mla subunit MlaD [Tsukamurella ocularis]MCS3852412.1 ABC-type transporter Mla subunit MlaD [Tsukamurella ocularis]